MEMDKLTANIKITNFRLIGRAKYVFEFMNMLANTEPTTRLSVPVEWRNN